VGKTCGTHGRGEKIVQGFGGKARRKETTWKTRCKWEDGIRMDLRETGWGCGLDSTGSRLGPVVSCCERGDEPSGSCAMELVSLSIYLQRLYSVTVMYVLHCYILNRTLIVPISVVSSTGRDTWSNNYPHPTSSPFVLVHANFTWWYRQENVPAIGDYICFTANN
jgi:hypothetical protein